MSFCSLNVGIDLSSRSVARQVFSAPHSLTSVFGMGTGGPCAIITPTFFIYSIVAPKGASMLALTYFPSPSPGEYLQLRTA